MKTFLIITQALYALCLAGWFIVWAMSVMVFDNGVQFWNSLYFITVSVFPIVVLACSVIAWVFRVRRRRLAIIVNLIPMLWIAAFGIFILSV